MAVYSIEISRAAEKQLKKLRRDDQRRVAKAILGLSGNPRPQGSRKLTGYDDVFRIRVGRYRVLYSVSGTKLIIIVLKIGRRTDVYRYLPQSSSTDDEPSDAEHCGHGPEPEQEQMRFAVSRRKALR